MLNRLVDQASHDVRIASLSLHSAVLDDTQWAWLSRVVPACAAMTALDLSNTGMTDLHCKILFAPLGTDVLLANTSVRSRGSLLTTAAKLETVDLCHNVLTAKSAPFVGMLLYEQRGSLRFANLRHNRFGDHGLQLLGSYIARCGDVVRPVVLAAGVASRRGAGAGKPAPGVLSGVDVSRNGASCRGVVDMLTSSSASGVLEVLAVYGNSLGSSGTATPAAPNPQQRRPFAAPRRFMDQAIAPRPFVNSGRSVSAVSNPASSAVGAGGLRGTAARGDGGCAAAKLPRQALYRMVSPCALRSVNLSDCRLGPEAGNEVLRVVLFSCSCLEELLMARNDLGDDAVGVIVDVSAPLDTLALLDLTGNAITDIGAMGIVDATRGFGKLHKLEHLALNSNVISFDGLAGLLTGVLPGLRLDESDSDDDDESADGSDNNNNESATQENESETRSPGQYHHGRRRAQASLLFQEPALWSRLVTLEVRSNFLDRRACDVVFFAVVGTTACAVQFSCDDGANSSASATGAAAAERSASAHASGGFVSGSPKRVARLAATRSYTPLSSVEELLEDATAPERALLLYAERRAEAAAFANRQRAQTRDAHRASPASNADGRPGSRRPTTRPASNVTQSVAMTPTPHFVSGDHGSGGGGGGGADSALQRTLVCPDSSAIALSPIRTVGANSTANTPFQTASLLVATATPAPARPQEASSAAAANAETPQASQLAEPVAVAVKPPPEPAPTPATVAVAPATVVQPQPQPAPLIVVAEAAAPPQPAQPAQGEPPTTTRTYDSTPSTPVPIISVGPPSVVRQRADSKVATPAASGSPATTPTTTPLSAPEPPSPAPSASAATATAALPAPSKRKFPFSATWQHKPGDDLCHVMHLADKNAVQKALERDLDVIIHDDEGKDYLSAPGAEPRTTITVSNWGTMSLAIVRTRSADPSATLRARLGNATPDKFHFLRGLREAVGGDALFQRCREALSDASEADIVARVHRMHGNEGALLAGLPSMAPSSSPATPPPPPDDNNAPAATEAPTLQAAALAEAVKQEEATTTSVEEVSPPPSAVTPAVVRDATAGAAIESILNDQPSLQLPTHTRDTTTPVSIVVEPDDANWALPMYSEALHKAEAAGSFVTTFGWCGRRPAPFTAASAVLGPLLPIPTTVRRGPEDTDPAPSLSFDELPRNTSAAAAPSQSFRERAAAAAAATATAAAATEPPTRAPHGDASVPPIFSRGGAAQAFGDLSGMDGAAAATTSNPEAGSATQLRESASRRPPTGRSGSTTAAAPDSEHRERLLAFYARYAPEKLLPERAGEIERALTAWRGREDEMFRKVAEKYNVPLEATEMAALRANTIEAATAPAAAAAAAAASPTPDRAQSDDDLAFALLLERRRASVGVPKSAPSPRMRSSTPQSSRSPSAATAGGQGTPGSSVSRPRASSVTETPAVAARHALLSLAARAMAEKKPSLLGPASARNKMRVCNGAWRGAVGLTVAVEWEHFLVFKMRTAFLGEKDLVFIYPLPAADDKLLIVAGKSAIFTMDRALLEAAADPGLAVKHQPGHADKLVIAVELGELKEVAEAKRAIDAAVLRSRSILEREVASQRRVDRVLLLATPRNR